MRKVRRRKKKDPPGKGASRISEIRHVCTNREECGRSYIVPMLRVEGRFVYAFKAVDRCPACGHRAVAQLPTQGAK